MKKFILGLAGVMLTAARHMALGIEAASRIGHSVVVTFSILTLHDYHLEILRF